MWNAATNAPIVNVYELLCCGDGDNCDVWAYGPALQDRTGRHTMSKKSFGALCDAEARGAHVHECWDWLLQQPLRAKHGMNETTEGRRRTPCRAGECASVLPR